MLRKSVGILHPRRYPQEPEHRPVEPHVVPSHDLQITLSDHGFNTSNIVNVNMKGRFPVPVRRHAPQHLLGHRVWYRDHIKRSRLADPGELAHELRRILDMLKHFRTHDHIGSGVGQGNRVAGTDNSLERTRGRARHVPSDQIDSELVDVNADDGGSKTPSIPANFTHAAADIDYRVRAMDLETRVIDLDRLGTPRCSRDCRLPPC